MRSAEYESERASEANARASELEGERDEVLAHVADLEREVEELRDLAGEVEGTLKSILASVSHWEDREVRVQVVALVALQLGRVREVRGGESEVGQ